MELEFIEFEAKHGATWKVFVARPWMVVMPGSWVSWAIPAAYQIPVEVLGAALVQLGVSAGAEQTLDNTSLKKMGMMVIDHP